jgi:hypothetical protein
MAMQSRLDICVVSKIAKRKIAIKKIISSNEVVRFTVLGVTAIRGLAILSGPLGKLASSLGEATLKKMNQFEGSKQDLLIKQISLEEANPNCEKTKYSKGFAVCQIYPNIRQLLFRSSRSQPDLFSPYLAKTSELAKARCVSKKLISEIHLKGDSSLFHAGFQENYAK